MPWEKSVVGVGERFGELVGGAFAKLNFPE
jgi:hypothetical protein